MSGRFVDVVFDGPPGHDGGRFIEVEDESGASISIGEWVDRGDGYFALRIPIPGEEMKTIKTLSVNVKEDFAEFCGGRYKKDGDFSGEALRELLFGGLQTHERIDLDVRGAMMPPSFCEEAFGGLVRQLKRRPIVTVQGDAEMAKRISVFMREAEERL